MQNTDNTWTTHMTSFFVNSLIFLRPPCLIFPNRVLSFSTQIWHLKFPGIPGTSTGFAKFQQKIKLPPVIIKLTTPTINGLEVTCLGPGGGGENVDRQTPVKASPSLVEHNRMLWVNVWFGENKYETFDLSRLIYSHTHLN